MSWDYSGDPSKSNKDAVRFEIQDTNPKDPLVNDEEITYILNLSNLNILGAAARLAEVIAMKFARCADEAVGQVSIKFSQKSAAYLKMRDSLRARQAIEDCIPYAGGISQIDKEANTANSDAVPPDFTKRMMDNRQVDPTLSSNDEDNP